jgi:hypothetical protein
VITTDDTVLEIREDVKDLRLRLTRLNLELESQTRKIRVLQRDVDWLVRGVSALLRHHGLTVGPDEPMPGPTTDPQ